MPAEAIIHYLNRTTKWLVLPASAIFDQDEIDDISELHTITFGDAVATLEYPTELKRYAKSADVQDLLDTLEKHNVYINLEV